MTSWLQKTRTDSEKTRHGRLRRPSCNYPSSPGRSAPVTLVAANLVHLAFPAGPAALPDLCTKAAWLTPNLGIAAWVCADVGRTSSLPTFSLADMALDWCTVQPHLSSNRHLSAVTHPITLRQLAVSLHWHSGRAGTACPDRCFFSPLFNHHVWHFWFTLPVVFLHGEPRGSLISNQAHWQGPVG